MSLRGTLLVTVAAAIAAATVGCGQSAGNGHGATPTNAVLQAQRFAALALSTDSLPAAPQLSPRDLRTWVAHRAGALPLPAGGNFNGIRWEEAVGAVSVVQADLALQHNARCQWLRAAADKRAADAERVLAEIQTWPVATITTHNELVDSVSRSGLLQGCRRSHDREAAYAIQRGRQPST